MRHNDNSPFSKTQRQLRVGELLRKEISDILNKNNMNETLFLKHLQKVIENKTTNADHMISKFSKNEDLNELYDK